MKNKNFVAVIPARSGSQEIKNKNIINMHGHPLLSYSIQAAKDSKFINKIFKLLIEGDFIYVKCWHKWIW